MIPDITRQDWFVNVRKFVVRADHLDDLVKLGTLPRGAARFLEAAVVAGLNILIFWWNPVGQNSPAQLPRLAIPPRDRVVACEEVFELTNPA